MIDKELLEQFEILADKMENMATKEDIQSLYGELMAEIRASETRTKVFIENSVNDRIRSLFDGYQGALENQAALKVSTQVLAKELDDVKTRLTVLENKTA